MKFFNHYKTIIISDIPLGASPEYFKKLIYFIKNTSCDKLIFCGDIVKGWQLEKNGALYKLHSKFIKTLLKIAERDSTQIIFVTGPEFYYKEKLEELKFSHITFVSQYVFSSAGNMLHVISGDISNAIFYDSYGLFPLKKLKYNLLLWLNKKYNLHRISKGKEYLSLLRKFNDVLNIDTSIYDTIREYEFYLMNLIKQKEGYGLKCHGIVYGHAAYSGIYNLGEFSFMSAGYWTESLTALVESNYGKWETIGFEKIVEEQREAMEYFDIAEEIFESEKYSLSSMGSKELTNA